MYQRLPSLVVLAAAALPAPAQEPPRPAPMTASMTPTIIVLDKLDRANAVAEHRVVVAVVVPVTVTVRENVDGVDRLVTKTQYVTEMRVETRRVNLKECIFFTPKGTEVPLVEALRNLREGEAIVVSPNRKMIDPACARLLRDDALIIGLANLPPALPPPPK